MTIFLIIIVVVGLLAIIYINNYNNLQYLKTKIEQAENVIDEALRNKYDVIIKINSIIKKELKTKKEYLKDIINIKDEKISNFDFDRRLIDAMNIINDLVNDHDVLIKNKDITELLYQIKDYDEKLVSGKTYYNKNTTESNHLIRKFPSTIVAKLLNYKIKPYFDGKDMQDDIIDDFKL
ncbi:MAG: LemA family protein [Bacilli bacterium]|nr:LemA family protein [Bacilli bacterium]